MERTAALRLDAEWTKVRSRRASVSPRERERMLADLIAALAPHAEDDLSLAARLSLRYGGLGPAPARHGPPRRGREGDPRGRPGCEEPTGLDDEHARWYAGH